MVKSAIEIKGLTKDYGNHKGIFDINLTVNQGEVYGFLGPNGAGKSTTIRNLMGFIRPDSGNCKIYGMDCCQEAAKIQERLGYLAGEIAFLDGLTGKQMLDFIADMKGVKDKTIMNKLIERFELNPYGKIRKMSKGMKQKIGIVCAFMNDPDIIVLDEPTSGLDPLMQSRFVELILEEKKKGKTVFMSSHIFEEVERTCDRTAIIRNGELVSVEEMKALNESKQKSYIVTFQNPEEVKRFESEKFHIVESKEDTVIVAIKGEIQPLINVLSKYQVKGLDVKVETLEEIFMHFYGNETEDERGDRK